MAAQTGQTHDCTRPQSSYAKIVLASGAPSTHDVGEVVEDQQVVAVELVRSPAFQQSSTRNSSHDVAADLARGKRQSAGDASSGKFLHASGGWATAPSGGGGSPGNTGSMQYNSAGAFAGLTRIKEYVGDILLEMSAAPPVQVADHAKLFARRQPIAGLAVSQQGPFFGGTRPATRRR